MDKKNWSFVLALSQPTSRSVFQRERNSDHTKRCIDWETIIIGKTTAKRYFGRPQAFRRPCIDVLWWCADVWYVGKPTKATAVNLNHEKSFCRKTPVTRYHDRVVRAFALLDSCVRERKLAFWADVWVTSHCFCSACSAANKKEQLYFQIFHARKRLFCDLKQFSGGFSLRHVCVRKSVTPFGRVARSEPFAYNRSDKPFSCSWSPIGFVSIDSSAKSNSEFRRSFRLN